MSEEIRNELKKELQNIATLYSFELDGNEDEKESSKASGERTLSDELNNISRLYNM